MIISMRMKFETLNFMNFVSDTQIVSKNSLKRPIKKNKRL